MKATLTSPCLSFKPSKSLTKYLNAHKISSKTVKLPETFLTDDDYNFIKSLDLSDTILNNPKEDDTEKVASKGKLLGLQDLCELYNNISEDNTYLHELLCETLVLLPQNPEIPRNEELEKRCQKLQTQQENRDYKNMTRNVDNVRKTLPEDTISYQLKQINRQLIAVLQFVISVIVGFVFGFLGIEMMVGTLDFGFRLLLGIMCSLIIGIAELYFLAKKLSEG